MKRIIIDFNKLTDELKNLFVEKYPEGYSISDIISFKNGKGETIEALELKTDETVYLVKVNKLAVHEYEGETDEAYDFFLHAKNEDPELVMNEESHDDPEELEDEFDDDSDSFFSDLDE